VIINGTAQSGATLSDRQLASSAFWPLFQPFSGSLRHETADQSGRVSNCPQCVKNPPRRAFEMADLAAFLLGGHGVVSSFIDILY
jgi:hypothetical protein